ncbi:unnamed protein product, partial [Rotaria sp. Silwood1]
RLRPCSVDVNIKLADRIHEENEPEFELIDDGNVYRVVVEDSSFDEDCSL